MKRNKVYEEESYLGFEKYEWVWLILLIIFCLPTIIMLMVF